MKKKRTVLSRLLAGVLCALMILGVLPLSLISFAAESLTEPTPPDELAALAANRVSSETVTDIYGNPVYLHCYALAGTTYSPSITGKDGSVVILYVMNTNTERIGKSSDADIVSSMLTRGYYVVVLDYADNAVTSPDLDWSIQGIRDKILDGKITLKGKEKDASRGVALNYVVPSGYDIAYNVPYFSFDKHGSAGTLERIVEIWNNDFRSVKRDVIVKWGEKNADGTVTRKTTKAIETGYDVWYADAAGTTVDAENGIYTKIGNTWANSIFDCVRPDGTFIELGLYADVIYPTGSVEDLPTMILFSSSETRVGGWTSATRPQLTGFLFSGYVGVVADYGYVPMARDDHYGYFSGNDRKYCVSGDNYTYSLGVYNGIKAETSLLRMLRTIGKDGVTLDGFGELNLPIDGTRIGVYGNSKAGVCARLGNAHPELLEEILHFNGHSGETRLEALNHPDVYGYTDPFVTDGATTDARIAYPEEQPYLTYANGTAISSQANLVYAQCGGSWESITDGNAPIFATGTQLEDGSGHSYPFFYRHVINQARNANVPFYGLISPEIGHNYGYGEDKHYGIDTYYAFHRYANYWLQNGNPSCEIIDVDSTNDIGIEMTRDLDYIYEIGEDSAIRLQFIGQIGGEEIGKVEIVDTATGEALTGAWTSSFGGQQWKFTPHEIKEDTYYRVTVPTTLTAKNGQTLSEEKSILFRTARGEGKDAARTETRDGVTYFYFDETDTADSYRTELRFTVTDRTARNTVIAKVATLAEGESVTDETVWEEVASVAVVGDGIYTIDVTDAVKAREGNLVFSLSQKYAAGTLSNETYGFDENTDLSSLGFGKINWLTVASIDAPTEEDEKMLRVDGFTRCSSWIDLDNELNGNYISNPNQFIRLETCISKSKLTAADYGRTFRITFRVYDTTSRLLTFRMMYESGNGAYDFNSPRMSYRTTPGWNTIEYEFTLDNLDACTKYDGRYLWISAENKSVISISDKTAISANQMAISSNKKSDLYAGTTGLTSGYDRYDNALAAMAEDKVTVKDAKPFYVDGFAFTEISTSVLPEAGRLVTHPKSEKVLDPTGAVSIDSTDPDATADGTLTVGGGKQREDKTSKKTYLKLSLADYTEGDVAYFSFKAGGAANTIFVYGIADANKERWDPATVTARTAPANDVKTSGVLLSEVWRGAPIATVSATDGQTVTVDITDYAREHKKAGAETLTLILTAKSIDGALTTMDFEDIATPMLDSNYRVKTGYDGKTSDGIATVTENGRKNSYLWISSAHANDAPHLTGLFSDTKPSSARDHKLWDESDIGRTFRITFRAKTDGGENNKITAIHFGMMSAVHRYDASTKSENRTQTCAEGVTGDNKQYGWYMYAQSEDMAVTSEWQTYTYTFTVDRNMLAKQMVRWTKASDGTWSSVNTTMEAISYFGITPVSTDYTTGANVLCIDDVCTTEISGETTVTPIAKAAPTVDRVLDFNNVTGNFYNYCQQNGYGNNDSGLHKLQSGVTLPDGTTGKVFSFTTGQIKATPNLTGIFSGTAAQTGCTVHKLWDASDIGKTFRITFNVMAPEGSDVTSLEYGLKSRIDRVKQNENNSKTYAIAGDETRSADTIGYSFNFYQSETVSLKAGEWTTCTLTFTVTEQMLPRHIMRYDNGEITRDEGQQAISFLGVRPFTASGKYVKPGQDNTNGSISTIYIDKITTEELPHTGTTLGMMDFDLEAYNSIAKLDKYISRGGFAWDTSSPEYDALQSYVTAEDGAALRLRFFASYNTLRFTGIFGTDPSAQTNCNVNRLWTQDDIGRTFRVSFRAKADRAGSIYFGMMRGYRATDINSSIAGNSPYYVEEDPDPIDYSFNFYGTKGEGVFTEKDTWYTFTYEFTVDANMLPKTIKRRDSNTWGTSPSAISYFGVQPNFDFTGVERGAANAEGRPTVYLDDITVREVTGFAESTLDTSASLAVSGAGNSSSAGILATPKAERENVRYTLLPFVTGKSDALLDAFLSFTLSGKAGKMNLYLLTGDLPENLTWETLKTRLATPVCTLNGVGGVNTVDVTEAIRDALGEKLTFILTVEDEGDPLTVTTPTLTVGEEVLPTFDPTTFKVKGNITLASDFLYHAYVPVLSALTSLILDGEALDLATLPTKVIDGTLYYVVTKPIAPKDGTKAFTLKATVLADGETKTATYNLSIPTYAAKIVNNNNATYNDTTKTLMKDILSYISAAMTYFDTSTDEAQNTITDIIGENYNKDLTDADVGLDKTGTATDSGNALSTVCLNLEATPSFIFYLEKGKESLAETFKFTSASSAPLTVTVKKETSGQKRTYIEVTTYAYAMGDLLTFTYTDEEGTQTGTYHLAAYYQGETNDANLSPLLLRLAKYAQSASLYRNSVLSKTEGN